MHVCHFCDTTLEGDYFRNMAVGLTRHGVRMSLVELGTGSPPTWLNEFEGLRYMSLHADSKMLYPLTVLKLAKYLRDESVDILHTHLYYAGLLGVLAGRRAPKTSVALMRHHTSVVRMLGSRLHVAADKWMAERADHVMAVSKAVCDHMRETDGIGRDIDVVYLGFDFERLAPNAESRKRVRSEFGFADNDFVIGYVGSFAPGKGQLLLIRAFERIADDIPNAKLFLVGKGTRPDVQEAAANFPKGTVVFAGWRTDVAACLNAMDLFVHPSLSEAFSQVLIEAMGTSLPVIATKVGGAEEVIENGVNGILIEPNDPEAIHREAVRLFNDSEDRLEMARKGMYSVHERFTAEQMVERQMALYEKWNEEKRGA